MTTPPILDVRRPNTWRSEAMQDVLLVSSFGLWAVLLGLAPVLAFHFVAGS